MKFGIEGILCSCATLLRILRSVNLSKIEDEKRWQNTITMLLVASFWIAMLVSLPAFSGQIRKWGIKIIGWYGNPATTWGRREALKIPDRSLFSKRQWNENVDRLFHKRILIQHWMPQCNWGILYTERYKCASVFFPAFSSWFDDSPAVTQLAKSFRRLSLLNCNIIQYLLISSIFPMLIMCANIREDWSKKPREVILVNDSQIPQSKLSLLMSLILF